MMATVRDDVDGGANDSAPGEERTIIAAIAAEEDKKLFMSIIDI